MGWGMVCSGAGPGLSWGRKGVGLTPPRLHSLPWSLVPTQRRSLGHRSRWWSPLSSPDGPWACLLPSEVSSTSCALSCSQSLGLGAQGEQTPLLLSPGRSHGAVPECHRPGPLPGIRPGVHHLLLGGLFPVPDQCPLR